MRRKIIAGNWKMNKTVDESAAYAAELVKLCQGQPFAQAADIVICPTYLALDRVSGLLKGSPVRLGAQDVHWENQGAFTGKVSADMLRALGVTYVILGHSEQRTLFQETDENVRRKVGKVLAEGMTPILCVGETLSEREAGRTEAVVSTQLRAGIAGLSRQETGTLVIAYEPVWAIGTGKNATDAEAQAVHMSIRTLLAEIHGDELAQSVRIQYGGSMKPDNAAGLLRQPDVDGGLIGGASLKADSFLGIIKAV